MQGRNLDSSQLYFSQIGYTVPSAGWCDFSSRGEPRAISATQCAATVMGTVRPRSRLHPIGARCAQRARLSVNSVRP